jgi:uncharacterized membrane protein YphA (DoxX/SURF4 family)
MENMQKLSLFILRIGIGVVIIWFAQEQLRNPAAWTAYLPQFTENLPISQITFVYLNGWFELLFSIAMMAGFYTRISAFLLAAHMFGIVCAVGYNEIGVRDFGIFTALVSICLYGQSIWSLDEYFEKKNDMSSTDNGTSR